MTPAPPDQNLTPLKALGPIALCTIFGANAVAIKVSLAGIGTFTAAGIRFALAAAVIALWARLTGRRFRMSAEQVRSLLVLCGIFTVQLSLFYLGLSKTLASRGALMVNTVPFFVLIFAHFFIPNDRLRARKLIGMVMGFSGVAVVLMEGTTLGGDLRVGDGIVFLAAIFWAANAVYTKTIIHRFDTFQVVLYPMLCAAPIQFLEGWLWDDVMIRYIDGPVVLAMLYQSLVCAALGFVIWNHFVARYGASTLHSFIFIMPIAGVAASGWVLDEPISVKLMLAVALIAAGIILVNIKPKPSAPAFPVGKSF